jgi:CRISPR/Cas system Type II protein with McrA/HNH and RuvC-like nuclease domain
MPPNDADRKERELLDRLVEAFFEQIGESSNLQIEMARELNTIRAGQDESRTILQGILGKFVNGFKKEIIDNINGEIKANRVRIYVMTTVIAALVTANIGLIGIIVSLLKN